MMMMMMIMMKIREAHLDSGNVTVFRNTGLQRGAFCGSKGLALATYNGRDYGFKFASFC
jgi:hypothetical protein